MKQLVMVLVAALAAACSQGETAMSNQKRALIVVTSNDRLGNTGKQTGWYLSEVTHVYYPLVEAGYAVDFASPAGGAPPMDESSRKLDDPENKRFLDDVALTARMKDTLALSSVDPSRYAVVHFAGGHGTMWDLPGHPDVGRIASAIYEHGGIVAAVCHGPAALVDVKLKNGAYLVAGKTVSVFSDEEEKAVGLAEVVPFLLQTRLEERGARARVAGNWQEQVSVSERLVTGQNPQSAKAVGREIVKLGKTL